MGDKRWEDSAGNVFLPRPMTERDLDDFKRAVPNRGLFEPVHKETEDFNLMFQGDAIVGCLDLPTFKPLDLTASQDEIKELVTYIRKYKGSVFAYNSTPCLFKLAATIHQNLNIVYHKKLDIYYKLIETLIDLYEEVKKRTKPYKLVWDTENRKPLPVQILKRYPFFEYEKWKAIIKNLKLQRAGKVLTTNVIEPIPVSDPEPKPLDDEKSLQEGLNKTLQQLEETLDKIHLSSIASSETPEIDKAIYALGRLSIKDVATQTKAKFNSRFYFAYQDSKLLDLTEAIIYHSVFSVVLDKKGNPSDLNGRLDYPILVAKPGQAMQRNIPMPGLYISLEKSGDAFFSIKGAKVQKLLFGGIGEFVKGDGTKTAHEFKEKIESYMDNYAKYNFLASVSVESIYKRNDYSLDLITEKISEVVIAALPYTVQEVIDNLKSIFANYDSFLKTIGEERIRSLIIERLRKWVRDFLVKKIGVKIVPLLNAASAVYDAFDGEEERVMVRHTIAYMILAIKGTVKDDMTIAAKGLSKIMASKFQEEIVQAIAKKAAEKGVKLVKKVVSDKKTQSQNDKSQGQEQAETKSNVSDPNSDNLSSEPKTGNPDHNTDVTHAQKKPYDVIKDSTAKELAEADKLVQKEKIKQAVVKTDPDQKDRKRTRKTGDTKTEDRAVGGKGTEDESKKAKAADNAKTVDAKTPTDQDKGIDKKIAANPPIKIDPSYTKKSGLNEKELNFVERSAEIYREEMIKRKSMKPNVASNEAHVATQNRLKKEFPNVVVSEEPTGITGPKTPRSVAHLRSGDIQMNRQSNDKQSQSANTGPIVELKRTAKLYGKTLVTNPRKPKPGVERVERVESDQIQSYEILNRELGVPVYVVDRHGHIFTPDPDTTEGWIQVGGNKRTK